MTAVAHSQNGNAPTETPRHVEHDVKFGLRWTSDDLGSLTLKVADFGHTWENTDDTHNVWALIPVTGKPDSLQVDITYRLKPGVEILHFAERRMRKVTGTRVPSLKVPVTWSDNGVPSIRAKHKDNIDLVLYNEAGGFVKIEVGFTTRQGKFFLTLQELYAGQVVRTNVAGAKKLNLTYHPLDAKNSLVATVLPLWEHSAFPGADFLRTWNVEGPELVTLIHNESKSIPLSGTLAATWNPPQLGTPKEEGRVRGICTFFNIAATYGFVYVPEQERSYFVHFSDIQREFALQPMAVYEFTPQQEGNKWKAKSVRRVR